MTAQDEIYRRDKFDGTRCNVQKRKVKQHKMECIEEKGMTAQD